MAKLGISMADAQRRAARLAKVMRKHSTAIGDLTARCYAVNPETGERCDRPAGHPGFHVAGDHLDPEATVWGAKSALEVLREAAEEEGIED